MKNLLIRLFFIVACCGTALSQPMTPTWEISLPGKLQWMQVNDWGILVASCNNGLFGINPQDGNKLWEIPSLTSINEEDYSIIDGTPLVMITDKGGAKKTLIINGLSGEVIFNSESENMQKVVSSKIVPEVDGVMITYSNDAGDGVALYNYLKAEQKWDKPFEKVKGGLLQVPPVVDNEGNILYCNNKSLFRLHGQTGEVLWQVDSKKKFIDVFLHPDGHTVYAVTGSPSDFFRNQNAEGNLSVSGGGPGKFDVDAYALDAGSPVWKKPVSYTKSKYSGVALGETDFFLLHTLSANKIDYETGTALWKKEKIGTGGERLAGIFPVGEGDLIYAAPDAVGRNYVYYVDAEGQKLWKKNPVVNGDLMHIEQLDDVIFYISAQETNMISLEDGKIRWEKDRYLGAGSAPITAVREDDGSYVMYVGGKLIRVLPDQRDWVSITSDIPFRGELPTGLRKMENGYLLTGNQNAVLFDTKGEVVYHRYYEAPEQSFGAKLALAVMSSAAIIYAAENVQLAVENAVYGQVLNDKSLTRKAEQQLATAMFSADLSKGLGAAYYMRFGEDALVDNYKLILTKKDKNIGFVKINLLNGEEEGQIVTADRTPDYAIDPVGDKVFLKSADDRVACYGL